MNATVFTKPVTINAPGKKVVFDGVDFTKGAFIKVESADEVVIRNCRFYKLEATAAKNYAVDIPAAAGKVKVVIEKCFFGDSPKNSVGVVYNLLELTAELKNGSSISDNYFTKGCCSHNQINLYGADDNAVINVNGNFSEYSGNMVRIGIRKEPVCTVNLRNNTYLETDPADGNDWAGLVIIQPYGKGTTTFNNMTVNIDKTVNKSGVDQLVYLFANPDDTHFDAVKNYPKVFVDGVQQTDLHLADNTVLEGVVAQ